jgi:hypothetical protein
MKENEIKMLHIANNLDSTRKWYNAKQHVIGTQETLWKFEGYQNSGEIHF